MVPEKQCPREGHTGALAPRRRILVAEDDPFIRGGFVETVRVALQRPEDWTVVEAWDRDSACSAVAAAPFDLALALVDRSLPGGAEDVVAALRRHCPAARIVQLGQPRTPATLAASAEREVAHHFMKPVRLYQLLSCFEAARALDAAAEGKSLPAGPPLGLRAPPVPPSPRGRR